MQTHFDEIVLISDLIPSGRMSNENDLTRSCMEHTVIIYTLILSRPLSYIYLV